MPDTLVIVLANCDITTLPQSLAYTYCRNATKTKTTCLYRSCLVQGPLKVHHFRGGLIVWVIQEVYHSHIHITTQLKVNSIFFFWLTSVGFVCCVVVYVNKCVVDCNAKKGQKCKSKKNRYIPNIILYII